MVHAQGSPLGVKLGLFPRCSRAAAVIVVAMLCRGVYALNGPRAAIAAGAGSALDIQAGNFEGRTAAMSMRDDDVELGSQMVIAVDSASPGLGAASALAAFAGATSAAFDARIGVTVATSPEGLAVKGALETGNSSISGPASSQVAMLDRQAFGDPDHEKWMVAPNMHIMLFYVFTGGNTRHGVAHYTSGLSKLCTEVQRILDSSQRVDATFVGSVDWARKNVAVCAPLLEDSANDLPVPELRYPKVHSVFWNNCSLKFNDAGMKPVGNASLLSQVWLNKLPSLCEQAQANPDEVTILLDANIVEEKPELFPDALLVPYSLREGRLGIPHYQPFEVEHQMQSGLPWFGQSACTTKPVLRAKFMAVRGHDCPRIMGLYDDMVKQVMSDSSCGCFDEEIVLARMFERAPDVFDSRWDMSPY